MPHGSSSCLRVEARLLDEPLGMQGLINCCHVAIEAHLVVVCAAPEEHLVVLVEGC